MLSQNNLIVNWKQSKCFPCALLNCSEKIAFIIVVGLFLVINIYSIVFFARKYHDARTNPITTSTFDSVTSFPAFDVEVCPWGPYSLRIWRNVHGTWIESQDKLPPNCLLVHIPAQDVYSFETVMEFLFSTTDGDFNGAFITPFSNITKEPAGNQLMLAQQQTWTQIGVSMRTVDRSLIDQGDIVHSIDLVLAGAGAGNGLRCATQDNRSCGAFRISGMWGSSFSPRLVYSYSFGLFDVFSSCGAMFSISLSIVMFLFPISTIADSALMFRGSIFCKVCSSSLCPCCKRTDPLFEDDMHQLQSNLVIS
eukprot:TRINITY_DN4206_c0_g1_i1.p1 TRINITY_DN4206_c0_g1~~TRINITY_DN4206_c0_g1_i1.p1  ORF type:complete len:308 (-),score=26.80 TRINITY_DN4206_c0_g1_i1:101-1024(-)